MPSSSDPLPPRGHDWPAHDLLVAVEAGLERGAHLLTAGEQRVAVRILALTGAAGAAYARLMGRKPVAFPLDDLSIPGIDDLDGALQPLQQAGLLDHFVPWSWRAELSTRARLAAGCRRLGLPTSGRRAELEARLHEQSGWDPTPWVRPRHRSLVRRLQRWASLSAWPAPADAILERMGTISFVDYPLTTGPALHGDRRALLRWEAVHAALSIEALSVDEALRAYADPSPVPRGLSLRGALAHALMDHVRTLERTDPEHALQRYAHLMQAGMSPARVAFRRARTLERLNRPQDAFEVLLAAREEADPLQRRTLARAGRRLGKSLKRGFPPEPPHTVPSIRRLTLPRVGSDDRPLWTEAALPIEAAIVEALGAQGREAHHVEGRLWRSLFALLFADAYFLDIPGALPVPRLAGPLDLHTAGFRQRRPLVDARLADIASGAAPSLLEAALHRYEGRRLAGLHPDVPRPLMQAAAAQVPGPALRGLMEHLLTGRSSGLPDLVVTAGEACELDAHPARVPPELVFVEIKGPSDSLSDRQRLWIDRLVALSLPVEVWEVSALDRSVGSLGRESTL